MAAGTRPSYAAHADHPADGCRVEFEGYVGIDYESSRWYITTFRPSEDTWSEGDREVVCAIGNEDDSEWTGSAEGSEE